MAKSHIGKGAGGFTPSNFSQLPSPRSGQASRIPVCALRTHSCEGEGGGGGWRNGAKAKRRREEREGRRRDEGRKGLRGRERETRGRKRRSVGERERRSCARSGGGKDAGAQDAGRRCSTTLHWQLHPSHTRYEPCSRATLHRDTRRTIVASAPTGGTSSSSIFVDVRPLGVCLASPRVERD